MKLLNLIFIALVAACSNAVAYFENLPERSWELPEVIGQVRKMPADAVPAELRKMTELVDRAAMLAGQEEDKWGTEPNYEKWEKASALFGKAIELYRQSRDSKVEMKRLAAYAMNKYSLLIWSVGRNVSNPALLKQQTEVVNKLLTELGNSNDPEVEMNILETQVDLAINRIMANEMKGNEATEFLENLKIFCARLNNDESQYHLGRFLLPYALATLGQHDDAPDIWKGYIEKNWNSDHPGVGSCIISMLSSAFYKTTASYTLEDIIWRYGASKDRRIQRLIALRMPALSVVDEEQKLPDVTDEMEDRYGSSPYPEVERWVVAALNTTVFNLFAQNKAEEGNELYERILHKYQDSPNMDTHIEIMELFDSMISRYEDMKNEEKVLCTAQRLEKHMKKLPKELQNGSLLIAPIRYQADVYESRGNTQQALKLYQDLVKEYESELEKSDYFESIKDKIKRLEKNICSNL